MEKKRNKDDEYQEMTLLMTASDFDDGQYEELVSSYLRCFEHEFVEHCLDKIERES